MLKGCNLISHHTAGTHYTVRGDRAQGLLAPYSSFMYWGRTNDGSHLSGPVASVEAADLGPRLPEDGVLGGDGEVTHHVQHVSPADCITCHHGYHWLGQPPDLHLTATDAVLEWAKN